MSNNPQNKKEVHFSERLGLLLNGDVTGEKTTQEDLAKIVGATRQTISEYKNGTSTPNADKLKVMANHFGVSTDYLLGLTDDPTNDRDLRAIFESLGLSSDAVTELKKYDEVELKIYNYIIEKKHMRELIAKIKEYCISTFVFLIRQQQFIYGEGITLDMHRSMNKWQLEQLGSKTTSDIYSGFIRDFAPLLETHAEEFVRQKEEKEAEWKEFAAQADKDYPPTATIAPFSDLEDYLDKVERIKEYIEPHSENDDK
jgi:transcriptional regulator with XRE-family HTH domain